MNYEKLLGTVQGKLDSADYNEGYKGQCVWYVRGRAKEKLKVNTGIIGDAKTWYNQAKKKNLKVGKMPKSDSIACFNGGNFGHVIYVEYVDKVNVYYTEANVGGTDGIMKKQAILGFVQRKGYQGCIYLREIKSKNATVKTEKTNTVKPKKPYTIANVNYRKEPSLKSEKVGCIPEMTTVEVDTKESIFADGYNWIKIIVNKKDYYVASEFIKF